MGLGAEFFISSAISIGLNLVTGLLRPPLKQKAPDQNLQAPRSSYNSNIPLVIGRCRVETNKIFPDTAKKIYRTEIRTQRGGKGMGGGGGGAEYNVNFATFMCLISQGRFQLERMIVNGKDVYYAPPGSPEYEDSDDWHQKITFSDGGKSASVWSAAPEVEKTYLANITYKGLSWVGFDNIQLDNEDFGNRLPQQVSCIGYNPDCPPTLLGGGANNIKNVVDYIFERAGVDLNRINTNDLKDLELIEGFLLQENGNGYRQAIEDLMQIYLFSAFRNDKGIVEFKRLQRPLVNNIPPQGRNVEEHHFILTQNNGTYRTFTKKEENLSELPGKITIKFNNIRKQYESDSIDLFFNNAVKKKALSISTRLNSDPEVIRKLGMRLLNYLTYTQQFTYTFTLTADYVTAYKINVLDLLKLPNGDTVQVYELSFKDNFTVDVTAKKYEPELSHFIKLPSPPPVPPLQNPLLTASSKDFQFFITNTRPDWNGDRENTVYAFATHKCVFNIGVGNGFYQFRTIRHLQPSTFGTAIKPNSQATKAIGTMLNSTEKFIRVNVINGHFDGLQKVGEIERENRINMVLIGREIGGGNQLVDAYPFFYRGVYPHPSPNVIELRGLSEFDPQDRKLHDIENFDIAGSPLYVFLVSNEANTAYYSSGQLPVRIVEENRELHIKPNFPPYNKVKISHNHDEKQFRYNPNWNYVNQTILPLNSTIDATVDSSFVGWLYSE